MQKVKSKQTVFQTKNTNYEMFFLFFFFAEKNETAELFSARVSNSFVCWQLGLSEHHHILVCMQIHTAPKPKLLTF